MIPVWVIALVAVLGAVCLALPLHIGMTGICLLLLAAVLLALRILKKKNAPEHWSRLLTGLTAAGMAVIFSAMGYIAVQGQDSIMAQDETPAFTCRKRQTRRSLSWCWARRCRAMGRR